MGGLHEGHLSLVEIAKKHAPKTVASIFVNPTQFGEGEDFEAYPRREAEDAALLGQVGCDLIYAPAVSEMYAAGFSTTIKVDSTTESLCGTRRPGHFDGVTTVVCKLLNQVQPDVAVFGEKDWQQLVTLRRMVRDLDMPITVVSAPTIREEDGLAMSSRNRYLTPEERRVAGKLNKALSASANLIAQGSAIDHVIAACRQALTDSGFGEIDYVELGRARLIDNVPIARTQP
ncbi:UNVERIFIED_CONTAM: hypothetical protein GTU68_008623 [Idotea baltica]|nr:hypothetical protein [Idotea baltica]